MKDTHQGRRNFIQKTAAIATGITAYTALPQIAMAENFDAREGVNVIGPKDGFTPQIGTLYSMMTWMRGAVIRTPKGLTVEQLDYLHDDHSNSVGAMLLHLAATERYHQLHTFENMAWGSWNESIKKEWDTAMSLGPDAQKEIKGHPLEYYLEKLGSVRQHTIEEFKKRDDKWLLTVDKDWPWGPTNNYCKWFHVCEHESNHNGQMKWIRSRIPGIAKD